MSDLTIITPTTGSRHLAKAILSVQTQSIDVKHLLVVDGPQYIDDVHEQMMKNPLMKTDVIVLPENTGRYQGIPYNGHRIYTGIPAVVNSEYISFLDEDNYYRSTFAEKMIAAMQEEGDFVATCRRHIYDQNDHYLCSDDFESIGYNGQYTLHDTNTYMFNRYYYIKHFARYFYGNHFQDRVLSEKVVADEHHVHIKDYLTCYRSPERLYGFFKQKTL